MTKQEKDEKRLNNLLAIVNKMEMTTEEINRLTFCGFMYSVSRLNPLQVAVALASIASAHGLSVKEIQDALE